MYLDKMFYSIFTFYVYITYIFTKKLFSTVKFDIRSLPSGLGVFDTIRPSPVPSVLEECLKQSIFVGVGLSKKRL